MALKVNSYRKGNVKSITMNLRGADYTQGGFKAGRNYKFSAEENSPEKVIFISGIGLIKIGSENYKPIKMGKVYDIPAGVTYGVMVDDMADLSYYCFYGKYLAPPIEVLIEQLKKIAAVPFTHSPQG